MKKLFLAVLMIGLSGCRNVDFENGEVPQQYLHLAKKLAGTYTGTFNGVRTSLIVDFDGNRPFIEVRNATGNDLIGSRCGSIIGDIKSASVSGTEEDPKIKSVSFHFAPNNCISIRGTEVVFDIKEKNGGISLQASILASREFRRECRWEVSPPPPYGGGPREVCEVREDARYLYGRFSK